MTRSNPSKMTRVHPEVKMILSSCLFLILTCFFMWSLSVQAQTNTNMVSCTGKDKNSNKLYRAEWTMVPAAVGSYQRLPSFDYFLCRWDTLHQAWLVYSFNCTGSRQGDLMANPKQTYCNFFSESTQKCDLDKLTAKCIA